jgi:hypothetical protein
MLNIKSHHALISDYINFVHETCSYVSKIRLVVLDRPVFGSDFRLEILFPIISVRGWDGSFKDLEPAM